MARILIGTFSVVGHVNPMLPLARTLVERGHDVVWTTSSAFRERIEATGARFIPPQHARDWSNFNRADIVDEGEKLEGIAALKADLKNVFIDGAVGQLRDVQAIARTFRPDVLLCDPGFVGGFFFYKLSNTPVAMLNVLPMGISSRDTAPNGLGLPPSNSMLGRLRNHSLHWLVEHVIFRDVQQHWNSTCAKLGLRPTEWMFDVVTQLPLYMQASVPGFEYPRSDLAPQVHFIGMMPVAAPHNWQRPAWWGELDGAKPVVHITQGTVANTTPQLIAPAIEGLANEDVLVVVSTGGPSAETMGLHNIPDNVRVASFLSYPELLPRTAAMVTNGGYGGTQLALSYGVPIAVAGKTEDKPEVAARVAWSGAGINLKTAAPTPTQVRNVVRALLDQPHFRQQAQALQAEYAQYNAAKLGAELVERLAATGQPILRVESIPQQQEQRFVPAPSR